MNREFYEQYHQKGGTYVIPVEIFEELLDESEKLKEQLNYLRSGEYYNQLRFENEMLQQVVDTNGVPSEVYDYIECLHRNTELLEENEKLKAELGLYRGSLHREHEAIHRANDLEDENNELKKQIEELKIHNPNYTPVVTLKKTIKHLYTEQEHLLNQQQEFLKYLEDYQYGASKSLDSYDWGINDCLGGVISKYKEIIGVENGK